LTPISGFNSTVNLTCSGAPSDATCSFSTNSPTLNGSSGSAVTVTVSTTARAGLVRFQIPNVPYLGPQGSGVLFALLGLATLALLVGTLGRRKGIAVNCLRLAV